MVFKFFSVSTCNLNPSIFQTRVPSAAVALQFRVGRKLVSRFIPQLHVLTDPFGAPPCHRFVPKAFGFLKFRVLIVLFELEAMRARVVLPFSLLVACTPFPAVTSASTVSATALVVFCIVA